MRRFLPKNPEKSLKFASKMNLNAMEEREVCGVWAWRSVWWGCGTVAWGMMAWVWRGVRGNVECGVGCGGWRESSCGERYI